MKPSTKIIAAVTLAYVVFLALDFAGVIGNQPGRLPPGMTVMLILLLALLIGDVARNRRRTEADR